MLVALHKVGTVDAHVLVDADALDHLRRAVNPDEAHPGDRLDDGRVAGFDGVPLYVDTCPCTKATNDPSRLSDGELAHWLNNMAHNLENLRRPSADFDAATLREAARRVARQ